MKHRACPTLSGVSCVSLWPKGPQTSKGQALRGPLSCSPSSWTTSPNLHWLCVVLLKGSSPQIIPRMLKECREQYSFLLFFFFHKIDISPTFCLWLFKKTVWEFFFLLILHPKLACCLFPNQFLHLTKRQYDLYFLFHAWFAVTMVSRRCACSNQKHWQMQDELFFFSPWCFFKYDSRMTEQKRDHLAERPSHLIVEMVKWQVSLFSTSHFPLHEQL